MPKEGFTDAVRRAIDQLEVERNPGSDADTQFQPIAGDADSAQSNPMEVKP
jgi:hypothetical protein